MIRPSDVIHPDTTIGAVHLTVADLGRSIAFYEEKLGLRTRAREAGLARLGAGGADLLVLRESPSAPRARGTTGLYHFAVLVPSRVDLARSLARLVETGTPLQGLSDHLVSEAVYLADPDGNGIEIYRDRPREEWVFDGGSLRMATLPLDPAGLLSETESRGTDGEGIAPGTMIGHVHLCVADVAAAEAFYVGVLGFERTVRYGAGASFVSAGGYHHHIGFNTWTSAGAGPAPPGAIGLRYFVVRLPGEVQRDRVVERIKAAGVTIEETPDGPLIRDPSGNALLLSGDGGLAAELASSLLRLRPGPRGGRPGRRSA